jgi:thioredoxin-dependent peroxiredoxin
MKTFAITIAICLIANTTRLFAQPVENFSLEAIVTDSKATVDSTFQLKDHKGKTVVLHFLLKTECPFCLRYTNQYAQLAAATPDVIHLFIKPDSESEIRSWMKQLVDGTSKIAAIYRDPGAMLARKFRIPDGYRFHGQKVHYPALVVLNGDGEELFRYVGKNNSDRMPKEEFVKRLESFKSK